MKLNKFAPLFLSSLIILSACTTNSRSTSNLTDDDSSTLTDDLGTNPLANTEPTLDLFDDETAADETKPAEVTTNITAADATATACMSSDNAWSSTDSATAQWLCLNNSAAQSKSVSQDTVMNLAASSLGMMNSCGLAVRQEIAQRLGQISGTNQQQITELFQLAKVKLAQCYYRVVNIQSGSMQWAPYQAQVYNYNSGNIWNLLTSFQQ